VVELRAAVESAVGNTYKMVPDTIDEQLQTALAPLFGLFGVLSSNKPTRGYLLDVRLKQLLVQMLELKEATSRSQDVGVLEDNTHAMKLDARSEPQVHHLSEAIATMQASLKNMQDQLASELVMVGTVIFISRSFTKNWLTTLGCNEYFVYFLDAVSLLALQYREGHCFQS
jgi:hypothetical protein